MYRVTLITYRPIDENLRYSHWYYKYWANQWFEIAISCSITYSATLEKKRWFRNEWKIIREFYRNDR
jgi:hypothetical protein